MPIYPFNCKYVFIKREKIILRRLIRYFIQIVTFTKSISFKSICNFINNSNKDFYILAPGSSLDKFDEKSVNNEIFIGLSRTISHHINCDFYVVEIRWHTFKYHIRESLNQFKNSNRKVFLLKGYSTPKDIFINLIYIYFMKLIRNKVYLISEIYQSDLKKINFTDKQNDIYSMKVNFSNLEEVILQGRSYLDFQFIDNNINKKFKYIGFDNSLNYSVECQWEDAEVHLFH